MRRLRIFLLASCVIPGALLGQAKGPAQKEPAKALQAQSASSINSTTAANGSQTVEIHNVSYEITGTGIHGRPSNERLVLMFHHFFSAEATSGENLYEI